MAATLYPVVLCNMCMIADGHGRVLVQHRRPKASNSWHGLAFPGGHVENGESITASVIREVEEETGLVVSNLHLCGIVEWEIVGEPPADSAAECKPDSKYIVFLFRAKSYSGEIRSSKEGSVEWMTLDEMRSGGMAPNMEEHIRVLMDGNINEAYGLSGQTLRLL